jgi:hypothetical protein
MHSLVLQLMECSIGNTVRFQSTISGVKIDIFFETDAKKKLINKDRLFEHANFMSFAILIRDWMH